MLIEMRKEVLSYCLTQMESLLALAILLLSNSPSSLHKNICPMNLRSPVGSSFGTLHKCVWWRLTGYIWPARISKTEQKTSFFVTVPSIYMARGLLPKKGCLPCSKMGKIICVQLENEAVSQHLFNPITKKARMAGVETEQSA